MRYVALLRGVNVGRANRVAMADLRRLVEGLGYADVGTLLNSGNVIFTGRRASPRAAGSAIEQKLAERLGVSSRVTVLTAADIAAIVAENPLRQVATNDSKLLVAVLATPADRKRLEPLEARQWAPDVLAAGTRAAYLWCADGLIESRLAAAAAKALGDAATMRNWATISKLHALACGPGE
jgi:uncharacterized protein (DUF1697 family)